MGDMLAAEIVVTADPAAATVEAVPVLPVAVVELWEAELRRQLERNELPNNKISLTHRYSGADTRFRRSRIVSTL